MNKFKSLLSSLTTAGRIVFAILCTAIFVMAIAFAFNPNSSNGYFAVATIALMIALVLSTCAGQFLNEIGCFPAIMLWGGSYLLFAATISWLFYATDLPVQPIVIISFIFSIAGILIKKLWLFKEKKE